MLLTLISHNSRNTANGSRNSLFKSVHCLTLSAKLLIIGPNTWISVLVLFKQCLIKSIINSLVTACSIKNGVKGDFIVEWLN